MSEPGNPRHPVPERFGRQFQIEPMIVKGLIVVFGLFGGIVAWSALASVSGAVIGQGIVSLESSVKKVQHLDGGIIAAIHVRDGDTVKAGQVLVSLDGTVHRANEAIVSARLRQFAARKARLEAERDALARVEFPAFLRQQARTSPDVAKLLKGERRLFAARRASWQGEVQMLKQRIGQHKDEIKGLAAQLGAKRAQQGLNREEARYILPLQKKRLVTKTRMLALAREAAKLQGETGALIGDIARKRGAISEVGLKIAQIGKSALQSIVTELRDLDSEIAEARERKVVLLDKLKHMEIRAPRSGRVHDLAVHTVQGVISPATPIMYIVPDNDRLILKVRVAPADIDNVRVGMEATISFSTLNTYKTLTLRGHAISMSAATVKDATTGASFFNAVVEIDKDELTKIDQQVLIPDLPAEVFFQTGKRSVLSYVLKPLSDQWARALKED